MLQMWFWNDPTTVSDYFQWRYEILLSKYGKTFQNRCAKNVKVVKWFKDNSGMFPESLQIVLDNYSDLWEYLQNIYSFKSLSKRFLKFSRMIVEQNWHNSSILLRSIIFVESLWNVFTTVPQYFLKHPSMFLESLRNSSNIFQKKSRTVSESFQNQTGMLPVSLYNAFRIVLES